LMASNWERDYLIRRKCKCLAAISRATRTSRSVRPNISKAITKLVAYPRRRRHGEHGPKSTSKTTAARRLARGAERQRIPLRLVREDDRAAGPPRDGRQMPAPHRRRRPLPRAAGIVAISKVSPPRKTFVFQVHESTYLNLCQSALPKRLPNDPCRAPVFAPIARRGLLRRGTVCREKMPNAKRRHCPDAPTCAYSIAKLAAAFEPSRIHDAFNSVIRAVVTATLVEAC
jgi:hypothetical protein